MHRSKHHVQVLSLMQLQNVGIDEFSILPSDLFGLQNIGSKHWSKILVHELDQIEIFLILEKP